MTSVVAMIIVVALIAVSLGVAVFTRRSARTSSEFYVAGQNISWLQNALALTGDYLSAASFLGVAGAIAIFGIDKTWDGLGYFGGYIVLLALLAVPLTAAPNQHPMTHSQCMTSVASADDFVADYSGPAGGIRFWAAWRGDVTAPIAGIRACIRADDGGTPGAALWQDTFTSWQAAPATMPYAPSYICPIEMFRWDHLTCYQVDITDIANPFKLTAGQVYWLELQALVTQTEGLNPAELLGWQLNGSGLHNSAAMWYYAPPGDSGLPQWVSAGDLYPELGRYDLAFDIVPEGTALSILAIGAMLAWMRHRGRGLRA